MKSKLPVPGHVAPAALAASAAPRRWAALWPPLFAVAVSLVWAEWLPRGTVMRLIHENGPVESLTVLLYLLVAVALWCVPRPLAQAAPRLAMTVMMMAFAARELDLHKAFTGTSVLKVSFYLRDHPLHQKLVALPLLAVIAFSAVWLLLRYARPMWQGLRQARPLAVTVAIFLVTLVFTKVIDRSFAILAEDFGVVMSTGLDTVLSALEEVVECSLPLIVAVGLAQQQGERLAADTSGR